MHKKSPLLISSLEKILKFIDEQDSLYVKKMELLSGVRQENCHFYKDIKNNLISILEKTQSNQESFYSHLSELLSFTFGLEQASRVFEKNIQSFLSEESHSFGFKPIDDVRYKIIEIIDKEIYPEEVGLFDWFVFENDIGSKNLSIYDKINQELEMNEENTREFKISSINDMINYLRHKEGI